MANFDMNSLFAALSGMNSGGSTAPYGAASSSTGNIPRSNMPGQQPQMGMPNMQGTWTGNMTQPGMPQMQQPQAGGGLMGMFKDIAGRAPAIYNAMQSKPGATPAGGFMSGLGGGMKAMRPPYAQPNGY